ncbi:transposase [Kribbella sp. NBC_01245]|uniref:RNA-guided endonuclease InsQ/TnpB family protein n=1 Tax=Kribbella sp. NBC_01245 TaxID=2903578 RepID=UPI002E2BD40A|nr:transposase [Kribbella sp. NBC_01245]
MSRYRLAPTPAQETALLGHCSHARYVWNLGLEQRLMWRPGRPPTPGYVAQAAQLTEARAAEPWLAAGSQTVQQQALRDLDQAWRNFFAGTHSRPTWRRAGQHEGFRIVGPQAQRVERLNRKWGRVLVPKAGWIKFRWSRQIPGAKSYRITRDSAARWHIAFAAIPDPIPAPGTGEVVGVDRGVAVSAALSTGVLLACPGLRATEQTRLKRLQRQLARCRRGSNRRTRVKVAIARLKAREADRRKDWVEKISTELARWFDVIRVEDLKIRNMTRSARGTVEQPGRNVRAKAGLNRGILGQGWGLLVTRLEQKAPGRVEKVNPAYTSQTCAECGHCASENRENQAAFRCVACGHTAHADVNAARNIAAGRAVTARRGTRSVPLKREPHLATSA